MVDRLFDFRGPGGTGVKAGGVEPDIMAGTGEVFLEAEREVLAVESGVGEENAHGSGLDGQEVEAAGGVAGEDAVRAGEGAACRRGVAGESGEARAGIQ